jgi:hypothetical protein
MSDYRNRNERMREILGQRAKTERKLHQSRRRGCVLWHGALNQSLDRGREQRRCRTEVGYDIFSLPETDVTSVDPARISPSFIPRLHPARHRFPTTTVPQTGPLLQTVGNQGNAFEGPSDLLRFVLFLYMIRCPHSRQRMGSRGLMSFLAPQSSVHY